MSLSIKDKSMLLIYRVFAFVAPTIWRALVTITLVIERHKIHGTVPGRIVLGATSGKAIVIGAGNYTSFAVDNQSDMWGWGLNTMDQTGTGIPNAKLNHTEV